MNILEESTTKYKYIDRYKIDMNKTVTKERDLQEKIDAKKYASFYILDEQGQRKGTIALYQVGDDLKMEMRGYKHEYEFYFYDNAKIEREIIPFLTHPKEFEVLSIEISEVS